MRCSWVCTAIVSIATVKLALAQPPDADPAPQPKPDEKPSEPFAYADFTWLNGNSRETETPLDSEVFTGSITNPGRYLVLLPAINGATATSGTSYFTTNPGDHFFAWDYSATLDYMPTQFVTWRIEYNHRETRVPYFAGPGGITPPGGNQGTPGSTVPGWAPDLSKTENRIQAVLMVRI